MTASRVFAATNVPILNARWTHLPSATLRSYGRGMSENKTLAERRWVAFGPAGAIGSIHRTDAAFQVRMLDGSEPRDYPSLDVAKSALHASLPLGSDWPEFREH